MRNNTAATTDSARGGRPPSRLFAAAEVVLLVGSILAFIWLIAPGTGRAAHITYYLLVALFAWLSTRVHGDSWRAVGLRLDNLADSARLVLPPTALLAAGVAAAGWLLGSLSPGRRGLAFFPGSFAWALVQQYALQAIVQRRLWNAGLNRHAPVVAALLFMLAHAPNPGLMAFTFAGGWLWSALYRRCPNLLTLAFSHAVLAAVVLWALPASVTGHLRVGPGYVGP